MERLTPEREKSIRAKEFFGTAKRVIGELLYEIVELRMDMLDLQSGFSEEEEHEEEEKQHEDRSEYEHDDTHDSVYQKYQEQDQEHDQVKSVLKVAVKSTAAEKFIGKSAEEK